MGKFKEINEEINKLKTDKEQIRENVEVLTNEFLNKIPEEIYGCVAETWKKCTSTYINHFVYDTFLSYFPNEKKSIKLIKKKFNEIHSKLKGDLKTFGYVKDELF